MAGTQSILHNITNMQRNAQEALPVMPNNGNPGGAYNMPAQAPQEQQPASPPDPYAFLKPSPYMDGVRAILAGQAQSLAAQQQQAPAQPIQAPLILPTGIY